MNVGKVPCFAVGENTRDIFKGAYTYTEGGKTIIHGFSGQIMLLDSACMESIHNKRMSHGLLRKLKSRGFIYSRASERNDFECGSKENAHICPEFFMIDITSKCNLSCQYCLRDINAGAKSISEDILQAICQYITCYCEKRRPKNVSIQFWGGEPLLYIDLILKAVSWIRPSATKIHYSVETNGVLLTPEMQELLFSHKIGVGVSIDGFRSLQDAQRRFKGGLSSFSVIDENLRSALKIYGDGLGTITTITRNNMDAVEDIIDYLACDLGIRNVKFNFVHASRFRDCSNLILTDWEAAETELRILHKIVELNKKGNSVSDYNIKVKLKNLLFLHYSDICISRGCHGGYRMIVFGMDGNYYPCELTDIPMYRIGSIFDDIDFIDSIERSLTINKYFSAVDTSGCNDCEWFVYCRGGCTVKA